MRVAIAAYLIYLLLGCQSQKIVDEPRIFDDSLMVKIMTDAFILHAAFADTYGLAKDSMSQVYSEQLLTRYDITQEEFDLNLDRIFSNPEHADTLYKLINSYAIELEKTIDFESEDIPAENTRINK